MSAHTPGPWQWTGTPGDSELFGLGGEGVIQQEPYEGMYFPSHHDRDEANARLIAAAPDGLEAADLAYLTLCQIPHDSLLRTRSDPARARLRNFIAKATGRDEEEVQNEYEARALDIRP